jgi:hypothetical protein
MRLTCVKAKYHSDNQHCKHQRQGIWVSKEAPTNPDAAGFDATNPKCLQLRRWILFNLLLQVRCVSKQLETPVAETDWYTGPKKKNNKKKKNANKPRELAVPDSTGAQVENDDQSDEPETPVMVLASNLSCLPQWF